MKISNESKDAEVSLHEDGVKLHAFLMSTLDEG
jgi:hypothetical protein